MNDNFKDCVVRLVVKSIFFFVIYDNDVCDVINLEKKCIYMDWGEGVWGFDVLFDVFLCI